MILVDFIQKHLKTLLVFAILFANPLFALAYQEQSLTIPNSYISSEPKSTFKLNAISSDASFAPSDVGIIGVKYLHRRGEMSNVIDVYPHTPAAAAGVRIGDQIIEVDHMNIMPFDADQVFSLIAGSPGQPVHLKLMRCDSNHGSYKACRPYEVNISRMDMNQLASDNVFRVYKYGQ